MALEFIEFDYYDKKGYIIKRDNEEIATFSYDSSRKDLILRINAIVGIGSYEISFKEIGEIQEFIRYKFN